MSSQEERIIQDLTAKCNKRILIEEQIKTRLQQDKQAFLQQPKPQATSEEKKNCCCYIA
jgi:hypothetical protein